MARTLSTQSKLLKGLEARFHLKHEAKGNFLSISCPKKDYPDVARHLKEEGFKRLLTVSAIDWLEEKEFEVYFITHDIERNIYVKVETRLPRARPRIQSLSRVWENAAMHEREAWEMFGITFDGNKMLRPLFLEDWKGPPPFRKDFDWRKYVKRVYGLGGKE